MHSKYIYAIGIIVVIGAFILMKGRSDTANMEPFIRGGSVFDKKSLSKYEPLNEVSSTGSLKPINITDTYGISSEEYLIERHNVLWMKFYAKNNLFIDQDGEIIGEVEYNRNHYLIDEYFVSPDGYHRIFEDNISKFISYIDISDSISSFGEIEELHRQSVYFRTYRYSDFPRESPAYKEKLITYIMFHDNTWKKISYPSAQVTYLKWKVSEFVGLEEQNSFISYNNGLVYHNAFPFNNKSITLDYFLKEKYFPRKSAKFGVPTATSSPARWIGTGYYTLEFNAKKLHFLYKMIFCINIKTMFNQEGWSLVVKMSLIMV